MILRRGLFEIGAGDGAVLRRVGAIERRGAIEIGRFAIAGVGAPLEPFHRGREVAPHAGAFEVKLADQGERGGVLRIGVDALLRLLHRDQIIAALIGAEGEVGAGGASLAARAAGARKSMQLAIIAVMRAERSDPAGTCGSWIASALSPRNDASLFG